MTASDDGFDPDAYIRAMAPALGLSMNAADPAGVSTFLSIAKGMSDILDAASVPENSLELAPVFKAGPRKKG